MTSNKYQKYNESIRLSEEGKEAILQNILAEQEAVQGKKPSAFPVFPWLGILTACAAAIVLFLLVPRSFTQTAAPLEEYMAVSEADGESREGAAETTVQNELRIDLSSCPEAVITEQETGQDGSVTALVSVRDYEVTIIASRLEIKETRESTENKERKGDALQENDMESAAGEQGGRDYLLVHDGIRYELHFSRPVSAAEAEELMQSLKGEE